MSQPHSERVCVCLYVRDASPPAPESTLDPERLIVGPRDEKPALSCFLEKKTAIFHYQFGFMLSVSLSPASFLNLCRSLVWGSTHPHRQGSGGHRQKTETWSRGEILDIIFVQFLIFSATGEKMTHAPFYTSLSQSWLICEVTHIQNDDGETSQPKPMSHWHCILQLKSQSLLSSRLRFLAIKAPFEVTLALAFVLWNKTRWGGAGQTAK